jgi:hypothetical protein
MGPLPVQIFSHPIALQKICSGEDSILAVTEEIINLKLDNNLPGPVCLFFEKS